MGELSAKERVHLLTEKLEQGILQMVEGEEYKRYLSFMARFPHYSFGNVMLILMQRPDATLVQSFTAWKKIGRSVKKGEKGIRILAPSPFKVKVKTKEKDENGKEVIKEEEKKVMGFREVFTFDVSQTEGLELPSSGVKELKGAIEDFETLFSILREVCPVPFKFEEIDGSARGYYQLEPEQIVVRKGMAQQQTVKTLVHEMVHQQLHNLEQKKKKDRNTKEVEAESVAFVVCSALGIDTSDYSFGYVAGWSSNKDLKELKSSLTTIQKTAWEFVQRIENKLQEKRRE